MNNPAISNTNKFLALVHYFFVNPWSLEMRKRRMRIKAIKEKIHEIKNDPFILRSEDEILEKIGEEIEKEFPELLIVKNSANFLKNKDIYTKKVQEEAMKYYTRKENLETTLQSLERTLEELKK